MLVNSDGGSGWDFCFSEMNNKEKKKKHKSVKVKVKVTSELIKSNE